MEKILSIHVGHDATALLLDEDGVLAISEERVSRVKNFFGFPFRAINEIFKIKKINWSHINKIAVIGKELEDLNSFTVKRFFNGYSEDYSNEVSINARLDFITSLIFKKKYKFRDLFELILEENNFSGEICFFDHHLCHIASSFAMFPIKNSLMLSLDGGGDMKNWTFYKDNNNDGDFLFLSKSLPDKFGIHDTPADVYSNTTKFLGFKRNRDEGKIMGLAAKGKPKHLDYFRNLLSFKNGQFRSRLGSQKVQNKFLKIKYYIDFIVFGSSYDKRQIIDMRKYFNLKKDKIEDICCSLQIWSEEIFIQFIKFHLNKFKINPKNLILSGGFFANILINKKIRDLNLIKNVYVTPNMGDGGLTLGGAFLYSDHFYKKKFFNKIKTNVFFGPSYDDYEIMNNQLFKCFEIRKLDKKEIVNYTVNRLLKNKIIGMFNGKMEFGPRSLCSRSILVNPSNIMMIDILNKKLKRSKLMPFGPIIRDKDAKRFLINFSLKDISTYFMTTAYDVEPILKKIAPCIVHFDNTARPQVLNQKDNSLCYSILGSFYRKSKIPVLINTSFNVHEEPIVMKPTDCIKPLKENIIDTLIINNYVLERKTRQ